MTLARLPFPPRGRLRSFSRNLIAAGVAAATLLVAGCEEMMSEEGESRPSEAAALQNVRKELGVPAGVQVVKVKSSSNTVTYMLRNPGASETSGQSVAGRASATSEPTNLGQRFDTPARTVRTDRETLEFIEQATFQDVQDAHERSHEEVRQAERFVEQFGELLEVGGLNVEAMRGWVERQKGVTTILSDWLHDAWPQNFVDLEFPEPTVSWSEWHDPVLLVVRGARGVPIAPVKLPEASGGVPPITYHIGREIECPDLGLTLADDLPRGLSFNPETRTITGTPTGTPFGFAAGRGTTIYVACDSNRMDVWGFIGWELTN